MFEILLTEEIQAPPEVVWEVITNTAAYPQWNTFVVACESTFQVGDPIHMKVRVLPFMVPPVSNTLGGHALRVPVPAGGVVLARGGVALWRPAAPRLW